MRLAQAAMRRRRRFPSSSASPSHWPARGPCGIGAARATPAGSRARPGPGRTEALEQWTESGTEYQRVDCGRSSCAAVKPSARAWRCLSLVRPRDCGARAGVFPSTVMTAIHVGVRSRSPRGWSDVGASDRGGFRAGDLVGLMSGYARRVTQPPPSGRTRVRSDRTPGA